MFTEREMFQYISHNYAFYPIAFQFILRNEADF